MADPCGDMDPTPSGSEHSGSEHSEYILHTLQNVEYSQESQTQSETPQTSQTSQSSQRGVKRDSRRRAIKPVMFTTSIGEKELEKQMMSEESGESGETDEEEEDRFEAELIESR